MRFTPSLPTLRAVLLLSTAWGLCPVTSAQAQTVFAHDSTGSRMAQQTAGAPAPPFISTPPTHQLGKLGGTARFSVLAGGQGPFTYEWFKDGVLVPNATSDVLELTGLTATAFSASAISPPNYYVRVSNAHGSDISSAVHLYQDSIGAGLPDWWRQQYFGSTGPVNPYADADGDGVTNGQEYEDGTRPDNAASRRARVMLTGPQSFMRKSPDRETYAPGTAGAAYGYSSGELQFGGFTGTQRTQGGGVGFTIRGSGDSAADVVLKGLFGSMPVQKAVTAPAFTYNDGSQGSVTGFATAPSGQWLGYGYFNRVNGQPRVGVARFAADGTLDASFNPSPNGIVNGMAILPDGKILLGGLFTEIYGQPRSGIVRFLANGAVDTTFAAVGGTEPSLVVAMEAQRDGKVLLGGQVWNGSAYRPVLRLNANGSVDPSFTTTVDDMPKVFKQQADGKILMGGNFTQVNSIATPKLVRLNLDGTLDGSFNLTVAGGALISEPKRVVVQPDGKILVGGTVQLRLNGGNVSVPVARLNADGTLDTAFTQKIHALAAGLVFSDIALQTDGRIVGVGTFTLASPSVVNAVRFKADGSVDPDCFVISRPNGALLAVAAQADGSLLMGGTFSDVAVAGAMVNDHQYLITPARMTWTKAESYAVKMGGHLVSIGGAKENSFIADTLLPAAGLAQFPVWHGLNDAGVQTMFAWASGEPVGYTNWNPGEPSQFGGENHAIMNWRKAYNGGTPYTWDDTLDSGTTGYGGMTDGPYHGIIEVDPGSAPATTVTWMAGRDMVANERAGDAAKATNPNATVPAWSYGRRAKADLASTGLTLFGTLAQRHTDGVISGWEAPNYCGVLVNTTDAPGFYLGSRPVHPGEMYLHPGSNLEYAIIRWTAPQAGTYVVTGFWQDFSWGMGDGGSAHIVVNGTVVFGTEFDNGNGACETRVLSLSAGDTIDFALGARGGFEADGTRFNAIVTKVEEGLSDLWWAGHDLATNEKPNGNPKELLNPNPTAPAWSYGRRNFYRTSGVDLYAPANHVDGGGADGPMEGWGTGAAAIIVNTNPYPDPVTNLPAPHVYNYGFGPNLPINSTEMLVAPAATNGPYPVTRWTAPEAGRYDVFAYWQDADAHGGNGVDGFILVNGSQVYGQNMDDGSGCSTVQSLDLKAGDLVDFVLGDRGDYSYDITKFNAVIVRPSDSTPRTIASGTVSQAATRAEIGATGKIDWANAAPTNNTEVNGNPFVIESTAGIQYHVRKATMGNFKRLTQGAGLGWAGNFAPNDAVLNHGYSDGPVIIENASLTGGCSAIGMQIQPNQDGPFTATLRAYDANGVLLGTYTANGTSGFTGDNSAVFLGVTSTAENIHSVSVDTNTTDFGGDFAINQVSIRASTSNSLSNLRENFARLVTTNSMQPLALTASPAGPVYAANAPATLNLTSDVTGPQVSFAMLESSLDGVSFQPLSYGTASSDLGQDWSFPVAALPPGANYFRAVMRNASSEEVRSHAVGPLVTPPVVTSLLVAEGEVGTPFTYSGIATGKLTNFTATSLPSWATATFDANSNRLTISGTPDAGGLRNITLQPVNAAGSTSSILALTITSSFTNWNTQNFTAAELADPAISGPLGDATGAGIPNLLKYALGIPPKQPGIAGLPAPGVADEGATKYLSLTYIRDLSADVTFTVEVSADLGDWDSGTTYTTEVSRVPQGGNKEMVTVRDNMPVVAGQERFIRLKVTQ